MPNNGLVSYKGLFGEDRILVNSGPALQEVLQERSYGFDKTPLVKKSLGPCLVMVCCLQTETFTRFCNPSCGTHFDAKLTAMFAIAPKKEAWTGFRPSSYPRSSWRVLEEG